MPIAAIDYCQHDARAIQEFNLLCLDYSASLSEPWVIAWSFEGEPDEHVAASFTGFFESLFDLPDHPVFDRVRRTRLKRS